MDGGFESCATCQTQNPAGARFCMGCGSSLGLSCPACQSDLPAEARFCLNCGHQLDPTATAPAGAQTAQAVTSSLAEDLRHERHAGERRNITIMFCDVVDSTRTAEHLDPEVWTEVMAAAIDRMVAPVEQYGGTVARLMGDAILAYFGAPIAHEDDPQRAVLAAVDIREGCRALATEVKAEHGLDVAVRIGINTGLVVVGDVGSSQNNEYAALGDAANVAARMEQTADRGTIRITGATHRRIAPFFSTEFVGSVEVKGRTDPVDAYVVGDLVSTPGQIRGIEGITAPMIGRDEELGQMLAAAERFVDGSGEVISVVAEAGLGKSRLVEEFRHRDATGTAAWTFGRCHSYQDATPYTPFRGALAEALALPHDATADEQRAAVDAHVADLLPDQPLVAVYLAFVLGLPNPPEHQGLLAGLDPPTLRGRVFDAVIDTVAALAKRSSLVLVIDDLHWADPVSIDLLHALLPMVDRVPLLLILLLRPRRDEASWGVHEAANRLVPRRTTTIELHPLDDAGSRSLIAELLKVEGLSESVRELILTKSEGNPFFVEEVVRSLLDDGVIVQEGDGFVSTREITDLAVPDTLGAVLLSRLDSLDQDARKAVQVASVIGREFPLSMLRQLTGLNGSFDATLSDLLRRELIEDVRLRPERVLGFHHALTRDAAYETLLKSTRKKMHAQVGDLLEREHPELVHELARHFVEADDADRAVPYLIKAGADAFTTYSGPQAIDNFRTALALWKPEHGAEARRAAFEGLGSSHMYQGDMEGARVVFVEMRDVARETGDPGMEVSALNKLGLVQLLGFGDYDGAQGTMEAARASAKAADDAEGLAEFYVGYCILNTSLGKLDVAEETLGEAADVCFTLDPYHRNFGLAHYTHTLILQFRWDDAWTALHRAKDQAEKDGDRLHIAQLKYSEAWLNFLQGDPVAGLELARAARQDGEAIGYHLGVVYFLWTIGEIARMLGRHDEAHEAYTSLRELSANVGYLSLVGPADVGLARLRQMTHGKGDAQVGVHLQAARDALATPVGDAFANHVHAESAFTLLGEGDLEAAERALVAGRDSSSATIWLSKPELLFCSGMLALRRADHPAARKLLQEAVDFIDHHQIACHSPRARLAEAGIAVVDGDHERLLERLALADDQAAQMYAWEQALFIRETAADLLGSLGLAAEASAWQQKVAEAVSQIADHIADPDTLAAFLASHALAPAGGA